MFSLVSVFGCWECSNFFIYTKQHSQTKLANSQHYVVWTELIEIIHSECLIELMNEQMQWMLNISAICGITRNAIAENRLGR